MAGVPPPGGTKLNLRKGSLLVTDRVSLSLKNIKRYKEFSKLEQKLKAIYKFYINIFLGDPMTENNLCQLSEIMITDHLIFVPMETLNSPLGSSGSN